MESRADNAIRRFLATLSLARLCELRKDAEIRAAARRNLRFNMSRYFRNVGGGRGAVVERATPTRSRARRRQPPPPALAVPGRAGSAPCPPGSRRSPDNRPRSPTSSFVPSARTPIITSVQRRSSSSRTLK